MDVKPHDPAASERQRRTFERTARGYDRYRPSYPSEMFNDILSYAALTPDDPILEVGTGTGRATLPLARAGRAVLGLEPAPAMAELARATLADYPKVTVVTTSFEQADVTPNAYGLVVCAQAYHWLDPATRHDRIADALRTGGTSAIFANIQVLRPDSSPFHERVQDVYRQAAPELAHHGRSRTPDDLPSHPLQGSGRFTDLEQRPHPWSWTLPTDDYIGLLRTHSPHAALADDVRERLLSGIADLITSEFDGHVTEHYVALLALARAAS